MALRSSAFLITMIIALTVAPAAFATDYTVGDDSGWKLDVNYTTWAEGKTFRVGDTITFMYAPGVHNVMKVNGTDFQKCASSNETAVPRTTGNDVIPLMTPGKKWYICTIGEHCSKGMKLVITVWAAEGPTPAPSPATSAATGAEVFASRTCMWMLAVMAAYKMIMA
ncbi:hypothetical protein ABFS83_05G094700 [Erythranthe nasuta]